MRQYANRRSFSYAEGFDLPLAVIKLEPRDDTKKVILMGELVHMITFFDDHSNIDQNLDLIGIWKVKRESLEQVV